MHESTHTVACMNDLALLQLFRSNAGFLEAHGLVSQFQGQGEATKRAAGDETKRRWRSRGSRLLFWGTNLSSNVGHGWCECVTCNHKPVNNHGNHGWFNGWCNHKPVILSMVDVIIIVTCNYGWCNLTNHDWGSFHSQIGVYHGIPNSKPLFGVGLSH